MMPTIITAGAATAAAAASGAARTATGGRAFKFNDPGLRVSLRNLMDGSTSSSRWCRGDEGNDR